MHPLWEVNFHNLFYYELLCSCYFNYLPNITKDELAFCFTPFLVSTSQVYSPPFSFLTCSSTNVLLTPNWTSLTLLPRRWYQLYCKIGSCTLVGWERHWKTTVEPNGLRTLIGFTAIISCTAKDEEKCLYCD